MSFTIGIIVGIVIGIMFSFSFPDIAVKVNDFFAPFIQGIFEQVVNSAIDFVGSGNFTGIGLMR